MKRTPLLIIITLGLVSLIHDLQAQFVNASVEHRIITQKHFDTVDWTIHLPSVSASAISSGFTYGDIYEADTKTLRLDIAEQKDTDLNLLGSVRGSYGGVTWDRGNYGISIGHEWLADVGFLLPETTIDAIVLGNAISSTSSINLDLFYQTSHRLSLGFYKNWDTAILGVNIYYLGGSETLVTESFDIESVGSNGFFEIDLYKDIVVQSSGVLNYNSLDDIDLTLNKKIFSPNPITTNTGGGFSAYGKAMVSNSLELFTIIDDIGLINWNRQAVTYSDQSSTSYSGIDITDLYGDGEEYSLSDTLSVLLPIEKKVGSFVSTLSPSVLIGSQYLINDRVSLLAIIRGKFINGRLNSVVELGGRYQINENSGISMHVGYAGKSFLNVGIGIHTLIFDRFEIYLRTMNPWISLNYLDSNYGHLNVGFNYLIR